MTSFEQPISSRRRVAILVSVCVAYFVNVFAMSSINVAIPSMALDLHASALQLSWIPTAFLLTMASLTLPIAKLADIYGRSRLYNIGICVFIFSSLAAAQATSIYWILLMRCLQGIGSALLFSTGLSIIMAIYTDKNKGMALGVVSTFVYIGLSLGPILGGLIIEHYNWRFLLGFPVPFMLLVLAVTFFTLKQEWRAEQKEQVDWLGSAIFITSLTCLFTAISLSDQRLTITLFSLGAIGLTLFIRQQNRSAFPLVNFSRLRNNTPFSYAMLASIFVYAGNYSLIFLLSLYLQYVHQLSALDAGKFIAIQAIVMATLSPIAGYFSDKIPTQYLATAGCLVMSLAYLMLSFVNADTSLELIALGMALIGVGFGLFSAPNNNAALSVVPIDRMSVGSALLNLSRNLGSIIGTLLVLLLVNVFLGSQSIIPENYPALITIVSLTMMASFIFSLMSAYFSYRR